MTGLRLGRLPARRLFGVASLDAYLTGPPPQPPTCAAAPALAWGMLGNDRLGDCTIAGAAHVIAASDFQVGEHDPVPTKAETVAQYAALTGGPDTGLVEADVLARWRTVGLFGGNRIRAYAPVPVDVLAIHRAIALTGTAYLGIQCPASAQAQFAAGVPWTVAPGSRIEGAHCIVAVGYDPAGIACVTWGRCVQVTWPFLATYCDEAWAVVTQAVAEAGHGPGPRLALDALEADLNRLGA